MKKWDGMKKYVPYALTHKDQLFKKIAISLVRQLNAMAKCKKQEQKKIRSSSVERRIYC